jgi:hypothetical protein
MVAPIFVTRMLYEPFVLLLSRLVANRSTETKEDYITDDVSSLFLVDIY